MSLKQNKVGILTYHYSVNYGAVLQAYALYSFINLLGYDTELIDYRPLQLRKANRTYLYYRGQRLINPLLFKSGLRKEIKLRSFISKHMKLSSTTFYSKETLGSAQHVYDYLICGSDEIWNLNDSHTNFGSDLSYFLDFINCDNSKKISYAPSFGYTNDLKEFKEKVSDLIKEFESLSARDSNSIKLIDECGGNAEKVLDPTFLIDYSNILKEPSISQDYVLLYGSFSKEQGECIETFARSIGLDVISIGARPDTYKPKINKIGVGIEEWLGYFSRASYICTNYFHGVIFSIIFQKLFVYFNRPEKATKVLDLLNQLGLVNRIVNSINLSDMNQIITNEIEWSQLSLEKLKKSSKNYLSNALNR